MEDRSRETNQHLKGREKGPREGDGALANRELEVPGEDAVTETRVLHKSCRNKDENV